MLFSVIIIGIRFITFFQKLATFSLCMIVCGMISTTTFAWFWKLKNCRSLYILCLDYTMYNVNSWTEVNCFMARGHQHSHSIDNQIASGFNFVNTNAPSLPQSNIIMHGGKTWATIDAPLLTRFTFISHVRDRAIVWWRAILLAPIKSPQSCFWSAEYLPSRL